MVRRCQAKRKEEYGKGGGYRGREGGRDKFFIMICRSTYSRRGAVLTEFTEDSVGGRVLQNLQKTGFGEGASLIELT